MSNPLFKTMQVRVTADGTILKNHADLLRSTLVGLGVSNIPEDAELAAAAATLRGAFQEWPSDDSAKPTEAAPAPRRKRRTAAEIAADAAAAAGTGVPNPPAETPAAAVPETPPAAPPAGPPPTIPAGPPTTLPVGLPPAPLPAGTVAGIPTVPATDGAF